MNGTPSFGTTRPTGFHIEILSIPGGEADKQPLYLPSLNLALTFAIQDLKMLWSRYRAGYEEELKHGRK